MSKRTLTILTTAAALALALGLVPSAQASGWLFGGGFHIGGLHFKIGYGSHGRHHNDYYYRTSKRIRYPRYSCSSACYRHGSYNYHHRSCPVVGHHFERHGYDPQGVFASYSPRRDRYYRDDYRSSYRDYSRPSRYREPYDDGRYRRRSRSCPYN